MHKIEKVGKSEGRPLPYCVTMQADKVILKLRLAILQKPLFFPGNTEMTELKVAPCKVTLVSTTHIFIFVLRIS